MKSIRITLAVIMLAALLLAASPSMAQGPLTLTNITVTMSDNTQATFDRAILPGVTVGKPNPDGGISWTYGLTNSGKATLEQGVFPNSSQYRAWYKQVQQYTHGQGNITLVGNGPGGVPVTLVLTNAWPLMIKEDQVFGGQAQVGSLTIAYDSVQMTTQ